jgi:hypothetical protein
MEYVTGPGRIFGFFDPAECLRYCFRELKRSQPGASHRYVAAAIGMKSSAALTLLMRGRIRPAPHIIDALARVFGLNREERNHLALLFELRRVRDPSVRRLLLDMILSRALLIEAGTFNGR